MRFIIQETERITKNEVFSLSDPKIHSVAVYKYVTCAKAEEIYFFVLVNCQRSHIPNIMFLR